jgi:hypothetical protein
VLVAQPDNKFTNYDLNESHADLKSLMFWAIFNETSEDRYFSGGDADIDSPASAVARDNASRDLASFLTEDPYCDVDQENIAPDEQPSSSGWHPNVMRIEHCRDHRYMMAQVVLNGFVNSERSLNSVYNPDDPENMMSVAYSYLYANFSGTFGYQAGGNALWIGIEACGNASQQYLGEYPVTLRNVNDTADYTYETVPDIATTFGAIKLINDDIGRLTRDKRTAENEGRQADAQTLQAQIDDLRSRRDNYPNLGNLYVLMVRWLSGLLTCRLQDTSGQYLVTRIQLTFPRVDAQIEAAIADYYARVADPTYGASAVRDANRTPTDGSHAESLATLIGRDQSPNLPITAVTGPVVEDYYSDGDADSGRACSTLQQITDWLTVDPMAFQHVDQIRTCYMPGSPSILQPVLWLDKSGDQIFTGYTWVTKSYGISVGSASTQRYTPLCQTNPQIPGC